MLQNGKNAVRVGIVLTVLIALLGALLAPTASAASGSRHVVSVVSVENAQPETAPSVDAKSVDVGDGKSAVVLAPAALHAALRAGTVREGYGKKITYSDGSFDFVGWYYIFDSKWQVWRRAYCVTPFAALSHGQTFDRKAVLGHVGKVKSLQIEFILDTKGTPKNPTVSAGVSQSVNKLYGNTKAVALRAKYLSASVASAVKSYLRDAALHYGQPCLTAQFNSKVLAGGHGTLSLHLFSCVTKHGLPGKRVSFTLTNMSAHSVVTSKYGTATVAYTPIDAGQVAFTASSGTLPGGWLWRGNPANGQQLMLAPGQGVKATATASYTKTASGQTVSSVCNSICNGDPPVTVVIPHAAFERTAKYYVHEGAKTVKIVTVPRSKKKSKTTVEFTGQDALNVTVDRRYQIGTDKKGRPIWGKLVRLGKSFKIDCPKPETPIVTIVVTCTTAKVTLSLLKNITTHVKAAQYYVNDPKKVVTRTEKPKATLSVTLNFARTAATTVGYRGEIQRVDGRYNTTGDFITLTIPKAGSSAHSAVASNGQRFHLQVASASTC